MLQEGDLVKKKSGKNQGRIGAVVHVAGFDEGKSKVRVKLQNVAKLCSLQNSDNFEFIERPVSIISEPLSFKEDSTSTNPPASDTNVLIKLEKNKKPSVLRRIVRSVKSLFGVATEPHETVPPLAKVARLREVDPEVEQLITAASATKPNPVAETLEKAESAAGSEQHIKGEGIRHDQYLMSGLSANTAMDHFIPEMLPHYSSGRSATGHVPWVADSGAWYEDHDAAYPLSEFSKHSIDKLPRKEDGAVLWNKNKYTMEQWIEKLRNWQTAYPNVTRNDGSNRHESVAERGKRTGNREIVMGCFDKCRQTWDTSKYSHGKWKSLLTRLRPDMWGNLICLSQSLAEGGASNNSLCFFDVDHLFPFSRGGRSTSANLRAIQNVANRAIKVDNILQSLNPIEMQCGLNSQQLIAMIDCVDATKLGRKDKEVMVRNVHKWLTMSPVNGRTFTRFQADVGRTTDGLKLIQYFQSRQNEENDILITLFSGTESAAKLYVRVRGCLIEVGNPRSKATFHIKDELYQSGYSWDSESDRKCWYQIFGTDKEKQDMLLDLQMVAQEKGFLYVFV